MTVYAVTDRLLAIAQRLDAIIVELTAESATPTPTPTTINGKAAS